MKTMAHALHFRKYKVEFVKDFILSFIKNGYDSQSPEARSWSYGVVETIFAGKSGIIQGAYVQGVLVNADRYIRQNMVDSCA